MSRRLYDSLSRVEAIQELQLSEGLSVEYKGEVPRAKSLAKDCCAFANTNGGLVIVGVTDPPQEGAAPTDFPGVPPNPDPVMRIEGTLANAITPPVRYDSKLIAFENDLGEHRCYVLLFVEPSSELHQVSLADVGTSYQRVGRNSVPMGPGNIRLRVEAILEATRRLEDRVEERVKTLPREAALVYTAVIPAAPFMGPKLDPASSTFRVEMNNLMSGSRACDPKSRQPRHYIYSVHIAENEVSVSLVHLFHATFSEFYKLRSKPLYFIRVVHSCHLLVES